MRKKVKGTEYVAPIDVLDVTGGPRETNVWVPPAQEDKEKRPSQLELIGLRFGMLEVLELAGFRGRGVLYKCRCDCGSETVISSYNLLYRGAHCCNLCRGTKKVNQ